MAGISEEQRRVRVRGREGEELEWSRKAARRAGRLSNWLDDLDPSEETMFSMVETSTTVLRTLGAMCEDDWSASGLDECSLTELAVLIEGACNLLAEQALEHAQAAFAGRLNGKRSDELRELLGAVNDFESDEERAAALAEPAFTPDSPMPQYTAAGQPALPVNDDAAEAALAKVGVGQLIELKGVSRAWRALGRRALCSQLCGRIGHADPRQLDEITELNLELLIEAGQSWEAARAGRLLLRLERLTGYGFVVDVAAVREVDLDDDRGEIEEEEEEQDLFRLLRGPAKHALCSCVTGEGSPPLKLLFGAIACAGSGEIGGIPVEHMRADTLTNLDLADCRKEAIGPEGAMFVASFIPVMGALTVANLLHNQLDAESAKMLAEVAKQKGVSLCGIQRDQTTADLSGHALKPPDAILLASDLSQAVVTGGLTSLNLSNNLLCGVTTFGSGTYTAEGITAIAEALRVNGALTSIDLSRNMLCGIWTDDDVKQRGNYITEGLNAIADALHVNGALTMLSLAKNRLGEEGTEAICEALEQNKTLKELDISGHYVAATMAATSEGQQAPNMWPRCLESTAG